MAQNNAFQIISGAVEPDNGWLGGTPAGPNVNPNAPGFMYDTPYEAFKREQAKLAEKQEAVIAMKLEAQANILRKRELEAHRNKQTARQLKALDREQVKLTADIQAAMIELARLDLQSRNNQAIIVLMAAYPYLNIGGTMH